MLSLTFILIQDYKITHSVSNISITVNYDNDATNIMLGSKNGDCWLTCMHLQHTILYVYNMLLLPGKHTYCVC